MSLWSKCEQELGQIWYMRLSAWCIHHHQGTDLVNRSDFSRLDPARVNYKRNDDVAMINIKMMSSPWNDHYCWNDRACLSVQFRSPRGPLLHNFALWLRMDISAARSSVDPLIRLSFLRSVLFSFSYLFVFPCVWDVLPKHDRFFGINGRPGIQNPRVCCDFVELVAPQSHHW